MRTQPDLCPHPLSTQRDQPMRRETQSKQSPGEIPHTLHSHLQMGADCGLGLERNRLRRSPDAASVLDAPSASSPRPVLGYVSDGPHRTPSYDAWPLILKQAGAAGAAA